MSMEILSRNCERAEIQMDFGQHNGLIAKLRFRFKVETFSRQSRSCISSVRVVVDIKVQHGVTLCFE